MDIYMEALQLWHSYGVNSVATLEKHLANFRILFAYKFETEKTWRRGLEMQKQR
ncbi:MAG: hypothetical protein WCQ41_04700 [Bacillota bacterium]